MLKLGWKAGPEQYPPDQLLDYAVAADQAGFDSIDISDHFHPWSEQGQACFTWTWLGAAAVQTKRIELGPGVTCPILRYHPSVIAQAAATVAYMAPGRTYLAVGTGESLNEYAATGRWPGYTERRDRLEEAIRLIRQLWTGEDVTFEGKYYQTRKARLFTRPKGPIPLMISAMVPQSAEFAGQYGDGLITVGGEQADVYKQILGNFSGGATKAGKKPSNLRRMIELNVAYTDDKVAAIDAMKKYWAGAFLPALYDQKIYTPKMSARNGEAVGSDTIQQKACISADPRAHVQFAKQYVDLGFTDLYFHCAGPDQRAFIEGYARDVFPELRKLKT
jgi:coenzyme F420-dependent glucose-6-phosphate dehydrogenase